MTRPADCQIVTEKHRCTRRNVPPTVACERNAPPRAAVPPLGRLQCREALDVENTRTKRLHFGLSRLPRAFLRSDRATLPSPVTCQDFEESGSLNQPRYGRDNAICFAHIAQCCGY
ncbi:hypothetical protein HBI56_176530 [Parastagonospora nodorum]|uniref:Uncharacterized protein n=1 Tax=Phaeosphaeria nodorum (strain SN15 / ATCC MYA-4574 / FGSC 10173) TaxID=321614 RepID=A0A7U2I7Z5_PHANO|nr:hypothetical protein HBH56_237670 [Parastagonospora nodorum]QRD03847.1 hypothetical protein JI435_420350 [Parastagonospora nodorum SN15]KAH3924356.1 hypothetical protein HBH54_197890 [Parastagonospora nodorum]KAH3938822.1 hypothetical protein HBH53_244620 [Parastagonospora nodorum]KAH3961657.1 hypothetical protein HBH51_180840 [Parastagonospora nodorum]